MSVWREINSWLQWLSEPEEIATFSMAKRSLTAKHADPLEKVSEHGPKQVTPESGNDADPPK